MGAMRKMRLPRSLNEPTCRITETASNTKTPPTKNSRISCLIMTAITPSVPPDESATEHRQFTDLGDVLNVEVGRPTVVAADVRQHREGACSDDRTANSKAIQPVRKVDGVRRADNHNANENKKWNKSQRPEMR